jgi:iron-sulfur cluster repair protein YtfE (RIC family)
MPAAKKTRGRTTARGANGSGRALERRLARLQEQLKTERARHTRQVAAVRRAADRQTASLVQEIALLRHHEARAETLARLVAERDTALAVHADRITQLESLLQAPVLR